MTLAAAQSVSGQNLDLVTRRNNCRTEILKVLSDEFVADDQSTDYTQSIIDPYLEKLLTSEGTFRQAAAAQEGGKR